MRNSTKSICRLLLASGLPIIDFAQASGQCRFELPTQSMTESIEKVERKSSVNVSVDSALLVGHRVPQQTGCTTTLDTGVRSLKEMDLKPTSMNERALKVASRDIPSAEQGVAEGAVQQYPTVVTGDDPRTDITHGVKQLSETSELEAERDRIPEVFVKGSRVLNMDIRRSRDDAQPYIIFERESIERSHAINLDEFLKQQLTASATAGLSSQEGKTFGSTSSINLRGLGANQTLILVDGHRVAGWNFSGSPQQPDINGIPLAAIERIEILPTTASGIYGGSATGGVINIVLRRDYSGMETKFTYDNSFDSGGARRQVDLSTGFELERGKTHVLFAASYSEADPLLVYQREFVQTGRKVILANNPGFFLNARTPPLGATTNIRSVTGEDLTLKDGTPLGSPITHVPVGYGGVATDSGAALVSNAGTYNLDLANTAQTGARYNALLNEPTVKTLMLSANRDFSDSIRGFVELSASDNKSQFASNGLLGVFTIPSTAPNNPFNQSIRVNTPMLGADSLIESSIQSRRAVLGIIAQLGRNWQFGADYTWNRVRAFSSQPYDAITSAGRDAVTTGTLDVLRDTNEFTVSFAPFIPDPIVLPPADTLLNNGTLRVAGPIWTIPGGDVKLTLQAEYRKEFFDDSYQIFSDLQTVYSPSRFQSVNSIYLESVLPVVSNKNKLIGVNLLELQLATRFDEYSLTAANTIFSTAPTPVVRIKSTRSSLDPTIGVRYQPIAGVMLRMSFGTGYLPPSVNQLVPGVPRMLMGSDLGLTDPLRGGEAVGQFELTSGGNSSLRPERSRSRSVGIVLTPKWIEGLRFSVDWTQIDKIDNIASFGSLQETINNGSVVPGIVTRAASSSAEVGPIVAINSSLINVARSKVEAYDFSLDYNIGTQRWGDFQFAITGTRLVHLETQLVETAPIVENVGAISAFNGQGGGLQWRVTSALTWTRGAWTVGWMTRYFDSYWLNTQHTIVPNQGSAVVPDQTYHDLFFGWSAPTNLNMKLLEDTSIQIGFRNVLNSTPPVDLGGSTGSNVRAYSSWGDPRMASYYISLRRAF